MSHLVLLAPVAACAVALLVLSVWRPPLACALFAVAVPLTAGMGRGTVVPVFRVNEVLLIALVGGFGVHLLARRHPLPFSTLDVVVLIYCLGGVLIPSAVALLTQTGLDQSEWMTVLGPVQYLLVYLVFSRAELTGEGLRRFLKVTLMASIPVAAVAVLELVNPGNVRQLVEVYYPAQPLPSWDNVYRPTSLLGFYSAVGAFGLLNFLLAFSLLAARQPGFSPWWLRMVMGVNVLGMLASDTYAPVLTLPFGLVGALLVVRRVPWREFVAAVPAAMVGLVLLWPAIAVRLQNQLGGSSHGLPETMATRVDYWQSFFIPALLHHGLWFGTATLMPPEVPRPLVSFVDNDYLWEMFRAGIPGLLIFLLLMAAVAKAGWASRWSPYPVRRALGATCLGTVACVLLLNVTSEYLTFTAVSQEFWMLVGALSGLALVARPAPVFVELRPSLPPSRSRLSRELGRLVPDAALLRSSMAVLLGFGLAKLFGFLFQVAAGRLLDPAGYGRLSYALAVGGVLSVLLTTAPLGLSRFLARHEGDREGRNRYYTNWLAVVAIILGFSAVITMAVAQPLGLGGWLLVGLLANLLGVAALETYREVQRGLGRYTLQSVFYVLANVLQLVAVLALALIGRRSPAVFLIVYGLSGVAALLALAPISRLDVAFRPSTLGWRQIRGIAAFARPVLLQAVFWNLWYSGDLILVQHLQSEASTGSYGAAKAIANGFMLIPSAIAFVLTPRVARLSEREVGHYLMRVLAFTAAVTLPLALALMVLARPLTASVFGGKYEAAAVPLMVLTVGMALYGVKSVLDSCWLGIGHPIVDTVTAGVAAAVTLSSGLWLIPRAGLVGAGLAFSAGALAQLLVAGAVTLWAFGSETPRVRQLRDQAVLGERWSTVADRAEVLERPAPSEPPGFPLTEDVTSKPVAEPGPQGEDVLRVLLVAEQVDGVPDEAYAKFVRVFGSELGRRCQLLTGIMGPSPSAGGRLNRVVGRLGEAFRVARLPELRGSSPNVVVYVSRSSLTTAALVRARILRLCCRAPVAFIALQGVAAEALRRFPRPLMPDLLLLPTDEDRRRALAAGLNAVCISGGVDLERFRPPRPGEKELLRRKWGLPLDRRILLHVGHLRTGRNLPALLPLAAAGVTVVVVASRHGGAESERLRADLLRGGVVLLEGYQPNVEELYRLADLYVFPTASREDAVAMPLSVLEALASDLPVVSLKFGALPERLGAASGVYLVDTAEELVSRALEVLGRSATTRHLAEPYAWSKIVERVLAALADLRVMALPSPGRLSGLREMARRAVVARRSWWRELLWSDRPGYVRPPAMPPIVPGTACTGQVEPACPTTPTVGDLGGSPGALSAAASFQGLGVERAGEDGPGEVLRRALAGRWPLLRAPAEALLELREPALTGLVAFLQRGGTLYVDGLRPPAVPALVELGQRLGLTVPELATSTAADLLFPTEAGDTIRELCGAKLLGTAWSFGLRAGPGWRTLACGAEDRLPLAVEGSVGMGRLVLSTVPAELPQPLWRVLASSRAATALLPMMLLRRLYGRAAWHPPLAVANFSIDDPALRRDRIGLRLDLLLTQAREHRFHVTVATVPRELPLADPAVVTLLRRHPELISACYHGCDHDGYEFYLPEARRARYPARSLARQRLALRRAVNNGLRFSERYGVHLDRVMVFPYGVGPAAIFGDLRRLGFIATCNLHDKFPLGAPIPDDPELGLRPADLAWEGYPLLWRRGLRDHGFLIDLCLGRPVLGFGHLRGLGQAFQDLVGWAEAVNRAAAPTWMSLDEVARHAYLQRLGPRGWEVLMTADEACLHNPDSSPRTFIVRRPYLPPTAVLEVDGVRRQGQEPVEVTVPASGTAVVRLATIGQVAEARRVLPPRYRCPLAPESEPLRKELA
jgi:O-antigen/teichoic acid export membrane protein/glycosyltransferase involved in cell wall biosynthesis